MAISVLKKHSDKSITKALHLDLDVPAKSKILRLVNIMLVLAHFNILDIKDNQQTVNM